MAEHHHEHEIPERTTAQGSQEGGVDFGHEEKDVTFAPVFRWFFSLVVVTGLTQLMLAVALFQWVKHEEKGEERLPRLFSERQDTPEPRVLPNRVDSPATSREPQVGPGEALVIFREREDKELEKYGLEDPQTHVARVPADAIAAVTAQPAAPAMGGEAADALTQPMPSSASGGTAMENRLR